MSIPTEFDPTRAETRQSRVAQRLALALAQAGLQGGLQVVYQPQIDLPSGQVVSFEALCRWHDEALGPVAPDEFIAVAEARGLIVRLGQAMLQGVLADLPQLLARWPAARVAVNVSGVELAQPDFSDRLQAVLQGADPAWARHLELEVTESVFHHDVRTVRQHLQALRALGLTVAIDDFGTGQSSLSRLHTLPFDKIKLDRSFVQALAEPMVQAIVRAMAQLADSFSRGLVVEGVETREQLHQLMQLGCRGAQGYLLGRPAALPKLLASPTGFTP